jgi:hypothetical protein
MKTALANVDGLIKALEWYASATYPDDGSGRPSSAYQKHAKQALDNWYRDCGPVNSATPAPELGNIRIESDGTPKGTLAFYPDGTPIGGVCSLAPSPAIDNKFDSIWLLDCELIGETPVGKCLRIEAGPGAQDARVIAPNGQRLAAKSVVADIKARDIPRVKVEFYVERGGNPKPKPLLGCATTAELINELGARAELGGYAGYRTIDAD